MAIALHHSRAKGSAKLILIGIANHDGDGGAMPSMATLAKYGGVDTRQARKLVRRLESLGEVRTHVQAGTLEYLDDHEQPNRYDFTLACPSHCDRSSRHRDLRRYDARPLWTTPGPTGQGGSQRTGPPRSHGTPKPSLEPDHSGSASTTGQARPRDTTPPCQECAAPNLTTCAARQQHLRPEDRHHYVPPPARREDTA